MFSYNIILIVVINILNHKINDKQILNKTRLLKIYNIGVISNNRSLGRLPT